MATSTAVIDTLKQLLKEQALTYRQLADQLELSESAVKRMFASGHMSLQRLDQICVALACDLTHVLRRMEEGQRRMDELPLDDEQALVDDPQLLLVAYCMVNNWDAATVTTRYRISETDMIRCLARLDRMKLIELLPQNRVRTLVGGNFRWQANGPIERFFRSQVQAEFFSSTFSGDSDLHLVKMADLSPSALERLKQRLETIGQLFDEVAKEDSQISSTQRRGMTMVLAIREWQYAAFHEFERKPN